MSTVHSGQGAVASTCDEVWTVGQHPAMLRGWIVRPVLFGSRVRVLPEHEGGHVVIKSEEDARLIAAAPRLRALVQTMLTAIDDGQIDSPELDGEPEAGIPPHRWHEEWRYSAERALAEATTANSVGTEAREAGHSAPIPPVKTGEG